jgi:hypothetical protein
MEEQKVKVYVVKKTSWHYRLRQLLDLKTDVNSGEYWCSLSVYVGFLLLACVTTPIFLHAYYSSGGAIMNHWVPGFFGLVIVFGFVGSCLTMALLVFGFAFLVHNRYRHLAAKYCRPVVYK